MTTAKIISRERRKKRIKKKIFGTSKAPRLAVHRSNNNVFAQLVDDIEQKTLLSVSTIDKALRTKLKNKANADAAKAVGKLLAERSLKKGIKEVVFDRSGYLYHGRVKALAEGAREGGLKF